MYKVESHKFVDHKDAVEYAKKLVIGMHYDDFILVEEWQDEGFWEPIDRAERDEDGTPIVR